MGWKRSRQTKEQYSHGAAVYFLQTKIAFAFVACFCVVGWCSPSFGAVCSLESRRPGTIQRWQSAPCWTESARNVTGDGNGAWTAGYIEGTPIGWNQIIAPMSCCNPSMRNAKTRWVICSTRTIHTAFWLVSTKQQHVTSMTVTPESLCGT